MFVNPARTQSVFSQFPESRCCDFILQIPQLVWLQTAGSSRESLRNVKLLHADDLRAARRPTILLTDVQFPVWENNNLIHTEQEATDAKSSYETDNVSQPDRHRSEHSVFQFKSINADWPATFP